MPVLANSKHELFAQAVAQGKSVDEAYVSAGYSKSRSNAARLSANEDVRSRIEEILSAAAERAGITRERIQSELAKIAFADIRKAVQWGEGVVIRDDEGNETVVHDVGLVASKDVDNDTAAAISEVSRTKDGLKIKLHDKQKALELLGRDIGMFKEKIEVSGQVTLAGLIAKSYEKEKA